MLRDSINFVDFAESEALETQAEKPKEVVKENIFVKSIQKKYFYIIEFILKMTSKAHTQKHFVQNATDGLSLKQLFPM